MYVGLPQCLKITQKCLILQIGASHSMSNVSLYVVDLKRVQPFMSATSRVTTVVNTGSLKSDEFKPGQVMRRSFVKDQNGIRGR